MASPSVTYTFSNGTASDATQVNQNFTDIINGITDATKDLSISALTCAGTATFNGNVALGNSSVDTLTITASVNSSIPFSANGTLDIGGSTLAPRSIYLGSSGSFTTRILSGATSSHSLTLPATQGAAGSRLENNGSGVLSWTNTSGVGTVSAKTTTYTATTADDVLTVDPSGGAFTVDLYTAVGNTGRRITITNISTTWNLACTIDPNGAQTINGASTFPLYTPGETLELVSDGTNWRILRHEIPSGLAAATTHTPGAVTTPPTYTTGVTYNKYTYWRGGPYLHVRHTAETLSGGGSNGSGVYLWTLPQSLSAHSEIEFSTVAGNYAGGDIVGHGIFTNTGVVNNGIMSAYMYDATRFLWLITSTANNWGSAYGTLNAGGGVTITYSFETKVRIVGWQG